MTFSNTNAPFHHSGPRDVGRHSDPGHRVPHGHVAPVVTARRVHRARWGGAHTAGTHTRDTEGEGHTH